MAKYMIPNEFPSDLYDFAKPQARAHWTSYPTYSYEQFYRANPRGQHNPADPKARYKALQAVADDERANENERKIARRLMAKMEAEGLVKPKKAKKNPSKAHHARRNSGEPVFIPVAGNAGPFTPNIFPYGVGGRPAIYPAEAAAKNNPRRKRRELDTESYRAAWETTRPRYTDSSPDELIRHRLEAAKLLRKHQGKSDAEVAKALGFDPREPGIVAKIKELRGDFYRTNPRTRRNPTEYRYGARNRPPGYATVPSGYIRVEAGISPSERRTRHGVVVYDRPLTQDEIESYELHPYMPLAEVVDRIVSGMDYGAEYAEVVREEGDEAIRPNVGDALDRKLPIYTDVPLDEVHKHVARELLRRFPEGAKNNPRPGKYKSVLEAGGKFAIPEKAPREGSFPIDTIKRARYALALVAAPAFDANPTTRQRVIKAVVAEYPQLRTEADHVLDRVAEREGRSKRAAANPRRRR